MKCWLVAQRNMARPVLFGCLVGCLVGWFIGCFVSWFRVFGLIWFEFIGCFGFIALFQLVV